MREGEEEEREERRGRERDGGRQTREKADTHGALRLAQGTPDSQEKVQSGGSHYAPGSAVAQVTRLKTTQLLLI